VSTWEEEYSRKEMYAESSTGCKRAEVRSVMTGRNRVNEFESSKGGKKERTGLNEGLPRAS